MPPALAFTNRLDVACSGLVLGGAGIDGITTATRQTSLYQVHRCYVVAMGGHSAPYSTTGLLRCITQRSLHAHEGSAEEDAGCQCREAVAESPWAGLPPTAARLEADAIWR